MGKFATILAYKGPDTPDVLEVTKQICQHIVGMNPKKIGSEKDPKAANADDETVLYHQDFFLNEMYTVGTLARNHNIELIDFKRIECGDESDEVQTS